MSDLRLKRAADGVMLLWSTTTHAHLVSKKRSCTRKLANPGAAPLPRDDATDPEAAAAEGAAAEAGPPAARLLSLLAATTLLTLWIAACADALLGALDGATRQLGWSHHFVTLVFVPLLGGIDGIVTAGALAYKGHVDFALSFAVGGAIQVLLGVLPVLVLVGW